MVKAPAYGAGDSRFDPWHDHFFPISQYNGYTLFQCGTCLNNKESACVFFFVKKQIGQGVYSPAILGVIKLVNYPD